MWDTYFYLETHLIKPHHMPPELVLSYLTPPGLRLRMRGRETPPTSQLFRPDSGLADFLKIQKHILG